MIEAPVMTGSTQNLRFSFVRNGTYEPFTVRTTTFTFAGIERDQYIYQQLNVSGARAYMLANGSDIEMSRYATTCIEWHNSTMNSTCAKYATDDMQFAAELPPGRNTTCRNGGSGVSAATKCVQMPPRDFGFTME